MDEDDFTPPPTEADLWKRANDPSESAMDRGQAWDQLAHMKFHQAQMNDSITYYEMAEKLYREAGWTLQEGDVAYWQGRANYNLDQYERGIECFVRASDRFHEVGHEVWLADATRGAAECNAKLEKTDEAIVQFSSAANFYEVNECWHLAGDCRLELGEIRGSSGHASDALGEFTKAREMFEKADIPRRSVRAADRLASAHIELGQIDEALDILISNLDVAGFLGNPETVAWSQYRLGWTYNIAGKFADALHLLDFARDFYSQAERFSVKADIDLQRFYALDSLGHSTEAEKVGRGLRAYWKSVANFERLVIHDANIATKLSSHGNFVEAIRLASGAVADAKKHCGDWSQRTSRLLLAEVFVDAGEFDRAREALESDMAEQWGDTVGTKIRHLLVLAAIAQSESRPHEARGITERVIELAEEAGIGNELGPAYEILADLADLELDHQRGRDKRAQAVALFLADGDIQSANKNARKLLPDVAERRRADEWHLINVDGKEPDVPQSEVTRESRGTSSRPDRREHDDGSAPEG